jgi:hypothetical protein
MSDIPRFTAIISGISLHFQDHALKSPFGFGTAAQGIPSFLGQQARGEVTNEQKMSIMGRTPGAS